jgi:sugar O-acyltransferase (sialic acid O-acetyltransferase NeuD family)
MKELIILGASGAGRELYNMALECDGFNTDWRIKGFLDDNMSALNGYSNYPPVIGEIGSYHIDKNDVFSCPIGSVPVKRRVIETILSRGGNFINLIHPKAAIAQNFYAGKGAIIAAFALITCDVSIGNFVTIQSYAVLGHDVSVGDFGHIGAFAFLGGAVTAGDNVTIHPGGIIHPGVSIGEEAVVGAGSVVLRDIPANKTVFGVPSKII